jgi:FkbM family methyltransferase
MNKTPPQFHRPDLEIADHQSAKEALKRDLGRVIKPGGIVIDVGANRGQFAFEILENFHDVKLICFEPVPEAYNDLVAASKDEVRIDAYQLAISSSSGEADLFVTESDVGSSLLQPIENQPSKWLTPSRTVSVKTARFDEFIAAQKISCVNLFKSDAQGFDLEVILSAGEYLNPRFVNSILVEVNFQTFYKGQGSFSQLLDELDGRGYRLAWMYPHRSHDEWLWWADALFIGK